MKMEGLCRVVTETNSVIDGYGCVRRLFYLDVVLGEGEELVF